MGGVWGVEGKRNRKSSMQSVVLNASKRIAIASIWKIRNISQRGSKHIGLVTVLVYFIS